MLYNAGSIPAALMCAALNEQDLLCRVFGRCLAGDLLDREVGDLAIARGPVEPRLFTYLRYNAELSQEGLDALGLPGQSTPPTCSGSTRSSTSPSSSRSGARSRRR